MGTFQDSSKPDEFRFKMETTSEFYFLESEQNMTLNNNVPYEMTFNDAHVITITAYSCLMIVSAIGNICLIRSLSRPEGKTAGSRVKLLIFHLAIADLLVTFLLMPLEIGWAWTVSWRAGDALCRIMAFFRIFGIFLSSFLLVVISIDRYLAVLHPLTVVEAQRKVKLMLALAWALSIVFSFPQMIIFHVESHPSYEWFLQCVTFNSFPSPTYELVYYFTGFIAMYAGPLLAIAFCYGSIVWALFRNIELVPLMARGSTFETQELNYEGVEVGETSEVASLGLNNIAGNNY